jgi:hypothetical protein
MMGNKMEMDLMVLMIQSMAKQPIWKLVNRCTRFNGTFRR